MIGAGAPLEQHQIDLHPDAAHPDHRTDHVYRGEPIEQAPPVLLEGQPVLGEQVVDEVILFVVVDGDADRGLLGDPGPPVRHGRQLGEGPATGTALLLLLDVDRDPAAVGRLEIVDPAVDVHAVVPDVELRRSRVPAHAAAIGVNGGSHRGVGPRRLHPFSRAATTRLAASRLTSHSNGPGRVSSKSRKSNIRFRSGVAHRPKFKTWASPQSYTIRPLLAREARSRAMTAAAPR